MKHRQPSPPQVPSFSSFHPSTFQMTTSRITRNSSKFLALEITMIPAGMQKKKKACFFFPLKIMFFPGTVQSLQRGKWEICFDQPMKRLLASQLRPRDLVPVNTFVSQEIDFISLKWSSHFLAEEALISLDGVFRVATYRVAKEDTLSFYFLLKIWRWVYFCSN